MRFWIRKETRRARITVWKVKLRDTKTHRKIKQTQTEFSINKELIENEKTVKEFFGYNVKADFEDKSEKLIEVV